MNYTIENITDKEHEKKCYNFLQNEVYSLLEWIKVSFEYNYKLNEKGKKLYPKLADQIFNSFQIDNFVFQYGINPLDMIMSNINK